MNYRPTGHDIQWTRNLIAQMNDGAMWGIPRAGSVWKFDKVNKVMTLVFGPYNAPDHVALRAIAPIIGWRTAHKPESLTPEQVNTANQTTTEMMTGTGKSIERIQ